MIAAGNDFDRLRLAAPSPRPGTRPTRSPSQPSTARDEIADFSSGGPTPVSLQMKPDVSAPGVGVLSSLPASEGTWGLESGTSMATPHVAGAAALLKERHPAWTVAQIKSALEQTGDPVKSPSGSEVPSTREGGGLIDLPRADVPLLFAAPTGLSFGLLAPGATTAPERHAHGRRRWRRHVDRQLARPAGERHRHRSRPPSMCRARSRSPQRAARRRATSPASSCSHAAPTRAASRSGSRPLPRSSRGEAKLPLTKAGTYRGTTAGGPSLISTYRYPTAATRPTRGPSARTG